MLPARFELVVTSSPRHHAGQATITPITPTASHWGLITAGAVQSEQQRTLADARATDAAVQACTSMDPSLKSEWADFLAGLTTWCNTPIVNFWTPWMPSNAVVVTGDTGDTMVAWEAQLANWQNTLATACASATASAAAAAAAAGQPPPPSVTFPPTFAQLTPTTPPGPPAPPSWLCSTLGMGCEASWADTLKWLAILGVAGLAAWYVGPLVVTMVGAAAGAVRKHAGEESR
jgi:hypothetical protein